MKNVKKKVRNVLKEIWNNAWFSKNKHVHAKQKEKEKITG